MAFHQTRSKTLFAEAKKLIPGGVNSPVRAFGSVGGEPLFIKRAKGSYVWDEDDQKFIDYVGSWGPALIGHAHEEVIAEIKRVSDFGISFGAPTEAESKLVRTIQNFFPTMEMTRLVSSGTEACMAALRVARGFTGRNKIIKFEGCYHGHADFLLVQAGSGAATLGVPNSKGVSPNAVADTIVIPFNDVDALEFVFSHNKNQIAAVILEPIVGNSGFIRPTPHFLKTLEQICRSNMSLLIFDEVMTGLRVAPGGAQEVFKMKPDMTVLGKVVGGGMPLAAYGGRRDVMSVVAPIGPVYQAGTLSGNPLSVACGLKTLEIIQRDKVFDIIRKNTTALVTGLVDIAKKKGIPFTADHEGGMFGFFFRSGAVRNFSEAKQANGEQFKKFFWGMLERGIYLAPSAYEAGFVSSAHSEQDIKNTLQAAESVFGSLN